MKNLFENTNTIQEKREVLKKLSKPLQELVKQEAINSVNEGLKELYSEDGHTELKTLHQWNKEGKRVKSGQKALCLWGRPKSRKEEETALDKEEKDSMDFYPVCFVFSNLQVQ